jgi:hypothetical protein
MARIESGRIKKKELWVGALCRPDTCAGWINQNSKVKIQKIENEFDAFEVNEGEKPYNIRHRCYFFSKEVIFFVGDCKYDRIYSSLFDQLVRSGTSIGVNVVEGKAGSSKRD